MASCGLSSAVPSCEAAPTVAFGSGGSRSLGRNLGFNSGFSSGLGSGYGFGGHIADAASLGVLSGLHPSCVNQIPPAEMVIDPASFAVVIPGPIITATPEPLLVGGHTPCAISGVGISGFGSGVVGSGFVGGYGRGYGNSGFYNGHFGGFLGDRRGSLLGKSSICGPCA